MDIIDAIFTSTDPPTFTDAQVAAEVDNVLATHQRVNVHTGVISSEAWRKLDVTYNERVKARRKKPTRGTYSDYNPTDKFKRQVTAHLKALHADGTVERIGKASNTKYALVTRIEELRAERDARVAADKLTNDRAVDASRRFADHGIVLQATKPYAKGTFTLTLSVDEAEKLADLLDALNNPGA